MTTDSKPRVLIAGGAGYIGSALVPALSNAGCEVDVLDLLWFGNHLPASVRVMCQDTLDADADLLSAYECVIFLAGLSNDPMAEFSPAMNFVYNAAAPAHWAYLAKRAGVKRFIYGSSCSVYGSTAGLCDETSAARSTYAYGISKLQGESACLSLQDNDFSVICLRQGTVSGYSPRMRLDLVVNTMFKTALAEGTITVNNPAIWRPVLAIRDAVSAYESAIRAGSGISGIFNITSGNFRVIELAEQVRESVARLAGLAPRIDVKHIPDLRDYRVTGSKAERVLEFKPTHGIDAIVQDLYSKLDRFSDFNNPAYYNIEVFKRLATRVPALPDYARR